MVILDLIAPFGYQVFVVPYHLNFVPKESFTYFCVPFGHKTKKNEDMVLGMVEFLRERWIIT
jgi:hypothetical protein